MLPLLKQIFISGKCQDGTKDTYVERYDLDNFNGMAQLQIDYIWLHVDYIWLHVDWKYIESRLKIDWKWIESGLKVDWK